MFMRRLSLLALALLVAFGVSRAALAEEDFKSKFQELYDLIGKSATTHQTDDIMGVLADDYVTVDENGNAKSHEDSVQGLKDTMDAVKSGTMTFQVNNVERDGDTFVVSLSLHSDLVLAKGDEEHHLVSDETDKDTWVIVGKGVKLQKSVTVSSQGTVDGKPMK
jgi:hypothetical protein